MEKWIKDLFAEIVERAKGRLTPAQLLKVMPDVAALVWELVRDEDKDGRVSPETRARILLRVDALVYGDD